MNYEELAYTALREVNFTDWFKQLITEFNSFDQRMPTTQKKEIIAILRSLGYEFKFLDRAYLFEETIGDFKLMIVLDVKSGMVLGRFYVYKNGQLLKLMPGHFAFLNRHLLNNPEEKMSAPYYTNYEDFKAITKEILNLYENFKTKFISLVNA